MEMEKTRQGRWKSEKKNSVGDPLKNYLDYISTLFHLTAASHLPWSEGYPGMLILPLTPRTMCFLLWQSKLLGIRERLQPEKRKDVGISCVKLGTLVG